MFQTNQGPSFPAHQFLFVATSAPSANDDHNGIFAAENTGASVNTGCIAPSTITVPLINPQGAEFTRIYPCFEHPTLTDLLDARGVSWRYYGSGGDVWLDPQAGGIWMAPNAIAHICVASGQTCTGAEWTSHVELAPSAILSDISTNCNLRGVSWVIPDAFNSDHSLDVRNTGGPSWVASIVNAVGSSRFVERNFLGSSMEGAPTFADSRSFSDLTEFFSLGARPHRFQAINAPLSASYFLSAKPSGMAPDND
jgi:hypothetical protein